MSKIKSIIAREILDSRGNPTIEAEVHTQTSIGIASVPSGASTGIHEAKELRDGNKRYQGQGVTKAIKNIAKLAKLLKGKDCTKQLEIDLILSKHKNYGSNATLAISLACARTAANKTPLYKYLQQLTKTKVKLPRAFFNIINGGKHADNKLSFQEFMISPNLPTFKKNLQAASEIYHTLKKDLHKKYGKGSTNVGDEGGFAPPQLTSATQTLNILTKAIKHAGYLDKCDIAMDCAASEFYKKGKYHVDEKQLTSAQLTKYYLKLINKYPIISIEDPFDQEDFDAFAILKQQTKIQIVGDDLTVTNPKRIQQAILANSCNCLLLKVNQIGTLSEALQSAYLASNNNWKIMVSHRSGETTDTFIADLAVALGSQIKSGAPARGERNAKYNQLLRIEEQLRKS
jgi:enolase